EQQQGARQGECPVQGSAQAARGRARVGCGNQRRVGPTGENESGVRIHELPPLNISCNCLGGNYRVPIQVLTQVNSASVSACVVAPRGMRLPHAVVAVIFFTTRLAAGLSGSKTGELSELAHWSD